ncbi:hypothetical protein MKD41_09995 [Lutibacter sp. A64]|uniref:DUF6973 domain-containing protein n=1 Tax=Lutibacter sp. A64 TaxID=2918526 RepID=UPI001F061592|nr:hypothetical protein [Lutibacter sp. A64]UMB52666.1 hypothetical protein MKD41_09995 [Lutibacter sp. A64]
MNYFKVKLLIVVLLFSFKLQAQSNWSLFKDQPSSLKKWALLHPFKAKKAFKISNEVIKITDSIANTNLLDKDKVGGQVDAFRHAYWMAVLKIEIGEKAARSLGKSYEKSNFNSFKKSDLEDGIHPDLASKKMDLFNNKMGLTFSVKDTNYSKNGLVFKIVNAIKRGDLKIIKKDSLGNYLTCNNVIISSKDLKKWDNGKCLISSETKNNN